ncbi:MAG: response regulator transcription factor [Deltaproteobacteria bacterium]|nr:response regulator transcription factor [Deltaproteobacteria bacterium]
MEEQVSRRQPIPFPDPRPLILIADSHRLCRESLAASVCESAGGLRVRTTPLDLPLIIPALVQARSALLLLSCCTEIMNPLPLLLTVQARAPRTRLMLLAEHDDLPLEEYRRRIPLDAVLQTAGQLCAVMKAIAESWPSREPAALAPDQRRKLTPRELQIARQVMAGLRNAQIAKAIGIAEKTVKVNLTNIFGKLGVSSRSELAALAAELLTPRPSVVWRA